MSEILNIWNNAPKAEELTKAMVDEMNERRKKPEPKSAIIDPVSMMTVGATRGKPTHVPYRTLRQMAKVPAISAIINTRLNQVGRFARRPRYDGDMGFRIGLKDRTKRMTDEQKARAYEIEEFFLKTGWQRNKIRKDNFNQFLRKITRDSLEIDAMVFEKVPDMRGEVAEVWAVDASTIELVVNNPIGDINYDVPVYEPVTKKGLKARAEDIAYVQMVSGRPVAEYTEDDLAYAIRNPRTDLLYADFGMSELETLMEIVTGIVNGVRYNTSYFNHSSLPQGVLEIVGRYNDNHLESFKRHWKVLTSGASGKWAVPVMAMEEGQGMKFTNFKNSNRDMEFNEFLEFLFNIASAVYQIDPNEVGFKSWTSNNGMMSSDNTAEKMTQSKDKGFVPLMYFLSDTFNSEIVDLIDPDYVFEWVGVDEEDEDVKLARMEKRLTIGYTTVNEERKENDKDEIEEDWANAPGNATLIQVYMAKINQELGLASEASNLEQSGAEKDFQKENDEQTHSRNMEVMDKEHEQTKEQKQMDHDHQKEMEQMKQKHAHELADKQAKHQATQDKGKDKKPLKKSFNASDEDTTNISIEWDDY